MHYFGRIISKARLILAAACVLALSPALWAQGTTGEILGSVSDTAGAVVPNITVTIENLATHIARDVRSNAEGLYDFTLVPAGHYSVRARGAGFKEFFSSDVALSAGVRVRVDVSMQVGAADETVTVTSSAPALQTDSSTGAQIMEEHAVQDLPLNGRNFTQLAQLTPGSNEGPPAAYSGGSRIYDRRMTSAISTNGNSASLNSEMIDGTDNNERLVGTIGVKPAIDAISEFRVQSNIYTADSGRTAGAVVNIITKSGGDKYHGSLYEFLRNDVLNAKNVFATGTKPEWRENQFGGSVGGPVLKKTFFFADYEQLALRQGKVNLATVPNQPMSYYCASNCNPIAVNYFNLYPAATYPALASNNYLSVMKYTQDAHTADARIDHHFSDRDQFFARYSVNDTQTSVPGLFPRVNVAGLEIDPGGSLGLYAGTSAQRAQNGQLNYTHIFTPALVMELKMAYTRIVNLTLPLNYGTNAATAFGLPGVNLTPDTSFLPPMIFTSGYASVGDGVFQPMQQSNNTFQYNGTLTWVHGAHSFKFGGALVRRQANNFQNVYTIGAFYFTSMQNFLAGKVYEEQRNNDLYEQGYRVWEPSGYVQDDWRVNRSLTLNLGVRYDVYTPYSEAHNRLSNFQASTGTLWVAGVNGVGSTAGVKTDYSNFAPRVGFAWSVRPSTVLRGGYGISFFPDNFASFAFMRNPPYATSYGPIVSPTSSLSLSAGFPTGTSGSMAPQDPTNPSGSLTGDDKNLRSGYLQQISLNVQHDFWGNVLTVGFVGELGRQLAEYIQNIDIPAPSPATLTASAYPFYSTIPNVTGVNYLRSGGSSSYSSLQASLERRYKNGLSVIANYTWAHGLNDVLDDSAAGSSYYALVPSQISTYDYASSDLDQRQRFTSGFGYELPFGKSTSGLKKAAIGGWQVNSILVWATNLPVTVVNGTKDYSNQGYGSGDRPNQVASTSLANPSISEWFNINAFQSQTFGTLGNSRRNDVYGPHQRHFDFSVFKIFPIHERFTGEFRAEAFNLTNTPNYAEPNVSLGSSAFGKISSTSQDPRDIQFALKVLF